MINSEVLKCNGLKKKTLYVKNNRMKLIVPMVNS